MQLLLSITTLALHIVLFEHLQTQVPSLFFLSLLYLYPARSNANFPRWDKIISCPVALDGPACDPLPEKICYS